MPGILRRLPFFDAFSTVQVQGHDFQIVPLQIIVWVSLGPKGLRDLHPLTPRFPAVLDPAFTDGFIIHREHLRQLAGFQVEHFRSRRDQLRTHNRSIPLHAANVWLHPNAIGRRDEFSSAPPFLLELHRGIGISSGADLYPRLPLLGARAFRTAKLHVSINYSQCRVTVSTARRFWFFG